MSNFRLGNLDDWAQLGAGGVEFPGELGVVQRVTLHLLSSAPVTVFAGGEDGEQLVAAGEGQMRVVFTVKGPVRLVAYGRDGESSPELWFRSRMVPQVVSESDVPSFATIEPRGVGPSSELRRMMLLMKLNADRREAILRGELQAMRSKPSAAAPAAEAVGASGGASATPSAAEA